MNIKMKNLISTLGSCGNKLKKYNLENKKIYQDFLKFCLENPNKEEYAKKQYTINLPNKGSIDFTENGYIRLSINGKSFFDGDRNGLDDKAFDGQTFKDENTNLIKKEDIKDMPLEKQLSVAKEYTNLLKEILHEAKYKEY